MGTNSLLKRIACFAAFLLASAQTATANDHTELLNATLIAKLHLDRSESRAQMLGAYQVTFRNTGEAPLKGVTVLLNPGLKVMKVQGPGGRALRFGARTASVSGKSGLSLLAADITLAEAVKPNSRHEIVIHYSGRLDDLSLMGLEDAREILHPDFTMLRAQGFAYPVFASPDMASIGAAWGHKPFHQVAFVEVNGDQKVVGNLMVAEKTLNGSKINFELKSAQPVGPLTLAVGDYESLRAGNLVVAYRAGQRTEADAVLERVSGEIARLTAQYGAQRAGAELTVASVRERYGSSIGPGLALIPDSQFGAGLTLGHALTDMWMLNPAKTDGHWAHAIDSFIRTREAEGAPLPALKQHAYDDALALMKANPAVGKTALVDFTVSGLRSESDTMGTLAFALLHDLIGDDAFWPMIRTLREGLSAGYNDTATLAEHLERIITHKGARKLVQNWFEKGRAGKDLAKAKSYAELLKLYR
jgi:hypothetical protein